ncbi:MAG: hypothetical protein IIA48_11355 [Bacteroidetes bacterium]|nr:hypothetical protein [Bacteroidota bacterium]
MNNTAKCKNCGHENALFRLNCTECNNYLRARVWNIDLWHDIRLLIESPTKGFQDIIWSEHKNFVVFIIIISTIKLMVDSFFLNMITENIVFLQHSFFMDYLLVLTEFVIFLVLFTFVVWYINKLISIETRIRDVFAIITYSFIPSIFALVSLFLVEIILFGSFLFSVNPSPLIIKPMLAYTLLVLEILVILWSAFLLAFGFYTQTKLKLYSIVLSVIFFSLLLLILYKTPFAIL